MLPAKKSFYWDANNLYIEIYIQTRASKNKIAGLHDGKLKIYITSPAIEGKANAHLLKFLAKYFGVAKSQVTIISGEHSRTKLICISAPNKNIAALTKLLGCRC